MHNHLEILTSSPQSEEPHWIRQPNFSGGNPELVANTDLMVFPPLFHETTTFAFVMSLHSSAEDVRVATVQPSTELNEPHDYLFNHMFTIIHNIHHIYFYVC